MIAIEANKISLKGEDVKKLKAIITGHRHNKDNDLLNHVKIVVARNETVATFIKGYHVISLKFHTESDNEFSFMLPVSLIRQMKSTKSTNHVFEKVDNGFMYESEGVTMYHESMSTDGYPQVLVKYHDSFEIDYNSFKKLSLASISTTEMESRPVLQSVLIRNEHVYSTDSHRLFKSHLGVKFDQDVKIHNNTIKLLEKLIGKNETFNISLANYNKISLWNDNFEIYVDEESSSYPEVDRLIPENFNLGIKVSNTKAFKAILQQIVKQKELDNQTITMKFNEDYSAATCSNLKNTIKTIINTVSTYKSEDLEKISFNAQYMLDAIKQVGDKELEMHFTTRLRPFVVNSFDSDNLALVLPVRTQ